LHDGTGLHDGTWSRRLHDEIRKRTPPELIGVREPSPFETICLGGDQVIVRVTAPALHPTPLLWIPVRGCCRHRGQVMMLPPACQSGERAAGQPAAAMRGRCVPQHCSTRPPGNWSGKESPRLCSRCDAGIPTASPTRCVVGLQVQERPQRPNLGRETPRVVVVVIPSFRRRPAPVGQLGNRTWSTGTRPVVQFTAARM
jgi:hypothetical protein